MKVYAVYNRRQGYVFCKDEIPEEILKTSYSNREVKEKYLKHVGLCIMDVKNFQLEYPPELQDGAEED